MTTMEKFELETDNLDVIRDVLKAIVPHTLIRYKHDDKIHPWIRHDTPPTRGWDDGSGYRNEDKSRVLEVNGQFYESTRGYIFGGAPFHVAGRKFDSKDQAAKTVYKPAVRTQPTRLWVCTAGCYYDEKGNGTRVDNPDVLIDGICYRLKDAIKTRKAEVESLADDEYFDGSVGLGYRIHTWEFSFPMIHASIVRIYYPK